MENSLDASLVVQSLNYHGPQLQKTWESERGEEALSKIGIKTNQLDYSVYQSRQKYFTFQDRGKRLKLHQFISKEACALFDVALSEEVPTSSSSSWMAESIPPEDTVYALMPPFETFLNVDKSARQRHFFETVRTGDLIIGTVINRTTSGMMLKVLCTSGANPRYVADINVKAFLPVSNIIPAVDKKNVTRNYLMNDTVCCEVIEVIPDTDKMVCGMKGVTRSSDDPPPKPSLGLLSTEDFPNVYKKTSEAKGESYETVLEKSPGFANPNCVQYLSEVLAISNMHCSNFLSLRGGFPPQDCAEELRQAQASKWAFRSVAEGIEHFKAGRHSEAFQCLNKALSIDPRNVEGLVARGALYANSGTFKKAIEDFETSLKLNPNHANARKYLGETLVALGRSYEDENKIAEAQKAYEDCLAIIPFHEEAKSSLEFLKSKSMAPKPLIEPAELLLPGLTGKGYEMKETLKQLLNLTEKKEKKAKKGKKKKSKKKQHRSSSSSSSSSDSSSSSSSSDSSSSDSDSSDSEGVSRKKKRRSQSNSKRARSLSPLSKRMSMINDDSSRTFNQPYGYSNVVQTVETHQQQQQQPPQHSFTDVEYENKVRKFLEMTKEDSDYEDKVRNFLEETARYKRDRKMQELAAATSQPAINEKSKKRKKKDKKSKKESKKKKKEKERDEKRKAKLSRNAGNGAVEYDMDTSPLDKKLKESFRKEEKRRSKRDSISEDEYERKHEKRQDLSEMDIESKLSAYYNKGEEKSPTPEPDKPKWKMQMNQPKMKKKSGYKDRNYAFDDSSDDEKLHRDKSPISTDKNVSIRRAMALKEPPPLPPGPPPPSHKRSEEPPLPEEPPLVRPKQNVVLDKFGSFRLAQTGEIPVTVDSKPENYIARIKPLSPPPSGRRPRSPPPSPPSSDRSSRSRSRPRKYRSRSGSRSHSRSSDASGRSRSARSDGSRSYYSRSRSRSRSGSRDRYRRFNRRGWGRGRGERGTYYRPRFNAYNGRGRGRGDFRRDHRYGWRDDRMRGYRGRGRPRRPFRGGYRDFNRRRYSRSRSPDRRRSRSYSPDRRDRGEKDSRESYSRYSENEQRSEGEYEERERYVDRKEYDGKWANEDNREQQQPQAARDEAAKE